MCHWLRLSRACVLGLHEDNFGLQPITFLVHEKSTRNCTLQVWLMFGHDL